MYVWYVRYVRIMYVCDTAGPIENKSNMIFVANKTSEREITKRLSYVNRKHIKLRVASILVDLT